MLVASGLTFGLAPLPGGTAESREEVPGDSKGVTVSSNPEEREEVREWFSRGGTRGSESVCAGAGGFCGWLGGGGAGRFLREGFVGARDAMAPLGAVGEVGECVGGTTRSCGCTCTLEWSPYWALLCEIVVVLVGTASKVS